MYIINQSLDIAMKKNGRATYSDFWRLNPYKKDILVWENCGNIYVETTFCDFDKIRRYIKQYEERAAT